MTSVVAEFAGGRTVLEIGPLLELVWRAGRAVMTVYEGAIDVVYKDDKTPLTAADRVSHDILECGLRHVARHIPLLSEEGKDIPYDQRQQWETFWLVDPLDGTKEFIKRNGEFTVNVAFIEGSRPVLGIIGVPALGKVYFGIKGQGSWVVQGDAEPRPIRVRPVDQVRGLTVVQSRSHPVPGLDACLAGMNVTSSVDVGSSLKFCAIAEGRADLYPRLGPTMEWDTAAGQIIVEEAGGCVSTFAGGTLRYNKKQLLNPPFIARGC